MKIVEADKILERLKIAGCDVEETVLRLTNDREFYIHLLTVFYQERSWENLMEAMDQRDYGAAFKAAHMLKGSVMTLGLMPVFGNLGDLLDDLRVFQPQTQDSQTRESQDFNHERNEQYVRSQENCPEKQPVSGDRESLLLARYGEFCRDIDKLRDIFE